MKLPFPITLKTRMFLILLILAIIGIIKNQISQTLPQLLIALFTTITLDIIINYIKNKKLILPDSAIITAFFIATALTTNQTWYIPLFAGIIAIASKHIIKINRRHIFNPAVFSLFIAILIFKVQIEWWASQTIWLVIILGIYLMYKMKNYILVSSYLITGIIISVTYSVINKQLSFGNAFFSINLFFMFFMLIEPMTTPTKKKEKAIYGILTALLSFLILIFLPQYEPSIFALVITNLFMLVLAYLTKTKKTPVFPFTLFSCNYCKRGEPEKE